VNAAAKLAATVNPYPNPARSPRKNPLRGVGPLAGIRVADFCWVGVGACATRALSDFGAEVVKIEDRQRIDMTRRLPLYKNERARAFGEEDVNPDVNRGGVFNNYNRNKLSVTISMRSSKGRALVDRLISASTLVTENFAPGVMERWGLTYERLRELCPTVIYGRMSGFGHSGPDANFRSYGPIIQAVSGLSFISGLPGVEPSGWGLSYMDNQAAYFNSAALMMAIYNRNLTGVGCEIDVSAVEVGIKLLGPIFLEVAANGRRTRGADFPVGNRLEHPAAAPHGVYPVQGEDRWIAIAVFDQPEWEALKSEMRNPAWARSAEFASMADRRAHQDSLDRHMGEWTKSLEPREAMRRLQAAGVRAAIVQNAEDLNEFDPQLAERGIFFEMDHPVIGPARFEGSPMLFSRTKQVNWRSGPLLGEDTRYVLTDILGLQDEEVDELEAEGVV
jgi:crotonobetainyl-CoA:carnitine CoA-transferase CaiB-like acyl-CoA transferase